MDKATRIRLTVHVEGEDEPANDFGDDSLALIQDVLKAGVIVISKRRVAMGLSFRKVTLMKIEKNEGGDDDNGD